jgi:hypothetical protein
MQAQQLQQAANNMYASLGLGAVNPHVMHSSAAAVGLGGRDVQGMSEEEKVGVGRVHASSSC